MSSLLSVINLSFQSACSFFFREFMFLSNYILALQKNVDLFASQPDTMQKNVDLFATGPAPLQKNVDLFASEPGPTSASSSTMDFFSAPDPVTQSAINSDQKSTSLADPFAAIAINNFDSSDPFGEFTQSSANASTMSHSIGASAETKPISNSNGSTIETKPAPKKDAFQVKSGIWADSLSRGIIDLNITARKLSFYNFSAYLKEHDYIFYYTFNRINLFNIVLGGRS